MKRYIVPAEDLGSSLLDVEKPVRYTGGEYGRLAKKTAPFQTVMAFPDLYEIGMSNQALRIIYNALNGMDGISCDRAFAPAPDFERLLREKQFPLYGLDTGISLKDADLLLFTLGYELGSTNILTMLDLAGIPLHKEGRGGEDPLVIMGGPCVSNPLPYSSFADCFWIGEAEAGFFDLVHGAASLKKNGAGRKNILDFFTAHPSVWTDGKNEAKRAVDNNFSFRSPTPAVFPVPSMKAVQHHGAVEIMRGCPNGCRFCHAGFWYRPMRQKSAETVRAETAAFINQGGYREISLSSLSTGDYGSIAVLVESLNREYRNRHISFQLPSLRVSGFSLPLLEKISEVRKSGLTFAVETPDDFRQLSINKKVPLENVVSILLEAKKNGWRGAKFYFMIGLPLSAPEGGGEDTSSKKELFDEAAAIVDFILEAAKQTGMHFNINVGTFVPKPHTPYQWAAQLRPDEALRRLYFIKDKLKAKGHKVGIQDPFVSMIEGVISRGDERAGCIIEDAWKLGARLDSWSEYFNKEIWEKVLLNHKELVSTYLAQKNLNQKLPWESIKSGVSSAYLQRELHKSYTGEFTLPCINNCNDSCGQCASESSVVKNSIHDEEMLCDSAASDSERARNPNRSDFTYRILFTFFKEKEGIFYSHLTLVEIFGMAMTRAGIPVVYSEGFNPLPRLEIVSPLPIGIESTAETALIEISDCFDAEDFKNRMNLFLPQGVGIVDALLVRIKFGQKKHSLSSLLFGGSYYMKGNILSQVIPFSEEKAFRTSATADADRGFKALKRARVFAFDPSDNPCTPVSYFDLFRKLYPGQ